MGDPQDSQQPTRSALASTWPNPPPFFEDFTEEKLERFRQFVDSQPKAGDQNENGPAARIPNIPTDLINLQPPAEPEDGKWRVFGDQYTLDDKLPTLEEQGMPKLGAESASQDEQGKEGKHQDRAFELKRLAKSLLLNFLELLGILSIDPAQAEEKANDLRTLFINFHHVLNEYRPHQARESTIALMQEHLDRTRAETAAIRESVDRTKRVIEGLGSIEISARPESVWVIRGKEEEEVKEGGQKREAEVWAAADELIL